ncbi:HD domain-containing protein [Helcococcus ovis]|uniref:HD domain-containing protein n=2 Tax=Helcococcus ovis TaxID=72026 RepID=A0A4R9C413_9FIRM|nr:HD domain-containing protein [Helcococcus ovis]TFF64752.1 HD domain-containing protein [Helcococcus ovis]TFF66621.1 HD domain-containing protein [Helcococcus ovis]TFF67996.1 HD domain-containing protein [Helcococcus ovis]WNZ01142.1 HD domain-containing protein [Helcococcus ovis]
MSFEKDLKFIILLENMKKIYRKTKIIGESRRENDAEHSWHIATMAMFLEKYSKNKIDVNKVIKMLLVHDLVEIFAGDTFAFDVNANKDKKNRELESMSKLKSHLDIYEAKMLENLWLEFEEKATSEAIYANAMDRLQPLISNVFAENGGTWKEGNVRLSQVLARASLIKDVNEEIYEFIYEKIIENVEKGNIVND